MRVGLTYDLRAEYLAEGYSELETAEFDRPDTIEAIEQSLRRLGHQTDRIGHGRQLVARLARGDRWDLVFNIAEGLYGMGREAQVPAILDLYRIPYTFSDPLLSSLCLHKGMTKHVLRSLGVPTPGFAVVERPEEIAAVDLPYPLFAKPVGEGTGKGVTPASKIHNVEELHRVCQRLLAEFQQPVLVETYLPGREFTVGILGTGPDAVAIGAIEVVLLQKAEAHAYSYVNKELCEELVEYRLVEDAESRQAACTALEAWRGLGCRDAGRVDLRSDASGRPQLMELNPLAGMHPEHSDLPILWIKTGRSYDELIAGIVRSASRRLAPSAPLR